MAEDRSVFARFEFVNDLIQAILDLRDAGFKRDDIEVFSSIPLEVEHLSHSKEVNLKEDEAKSLNEVLFKEGRRVGFFTRIGAAIGISLAVILVGIVPITYPLQPSQQGGMPIVPFPPMGILSFETMILIAFIASILGFAWLTRNDRIKTKVYDKLLTVDRFAIGLTDLSPDRMKEATEIFKQNSTEDIHEFLEDEPGKTQLSESV